MRKRLFDGFAFYPPHTPVKKLTDHYNIWRGFNIEPVQSKLPPDLYLKALHRLCEGDNSILTYVLKWMAHAVQLPGILPRKALVFRSRRATMVW